MLSKIMVGNVSEDCIAIASDTKGPLAAASDAGMNSQFYFLLVVKSFK